MAKVTQVDFPPREIVSYTKETQTPVVTQEKEGESLFTFVRLALPELGAQHIDAEPDNNAVLQHCMLLYCVEVNAEHYEKGGGFEICQESTRCATSIWAVHVTVCNMNGTGAWLFPAARQPTLLHMSSMFPAACSFCCCAQCSRVLD